MKKVFYASALAMLLSGAAVSASAENFTIGVSNTVQGNGWREEMICAIKAQALASGKVESLNIAHRNTDSAGQLEDIRNLMQAGVDAIIINPSSADAVNSAIKEATDAGIVVIAVDQAVSEPSAYVLANNQQQYAYLGAKWLFEQLGGDGSVVYMRGAAGAGADNERHIGFNRALDEFPDIKIVQEVFTGWQQDQAKQQILNIIGSGIPFDGVWTSGMDNIIVDAFIESDLPLVPIVGADNAGFVNQLITIDGLVGAAVTNPGAVGGAGVNLAIDILQGNLPDDKAVYATPALWENVTDAGKVQLAGAQHPTLDPEWPLSWSIEGSTTYTLEQLVACKGPGE